MRYWVSAWLAVAVLLAPACCALGQQGGGARRQRRPRTVLYKLKADAAADKAAALEAARGRFGMRKVRDLVHGRVLQAEVRAAGGLTEEEICARLMATGAVQYAEPDYLIEPAGVIPDDTHYNVMWHHTMINSPWAWEVSTGTSTVLAAVCDTGIDTDHPDLAAHIDLAHGYNVVDGTTNFEDENGHGTMCAGALGAIGNNSIGVAGMAWNVMILPVRISNQPTGSAYTSDINAGITYAADQGAEVVSLSYSPGNSINMEDAALYLRSQGGLLFVAAGNQGALQTWYDLPSRISVGATDEYDQKTSFSSWGPYIDIVAPGQNFWTTKIGSTYGTASGTSLATPLAAGVAALIYSVNPSFTPEQVENFIFNTCVDLGDPGEDDYYGKGRINAAAALAAASPTTPLPPMPKAGPDQDVTADGSGTVTVTLDGSGSSDFNGSITAYVWKDGAEPLATGQTAEVVLPVGTYAITLTVTDNDSNTAADTMAVQVWPAPTVTYQVATSGDDTYASTAGGGWSNGAMYFPYNSDARRAFVRWAIDIPAGSTIVAARMKVQSDGGATNGQTATTRLSLMDYDSCPSYTAVNPFYWSVTDTHYDWPLPSLWPDGQWHVSGDVKALVQAFIDRPGYSSGNYMGVRSSWVDTGVPYQVPRRAYQYDHAASAAAVLDVTYATGDPPGGEVTQWSVAATHGPGGEMALPAEDNYVESRAAGISKVRVAFDGPLDPGTVGIGSVFIEGQVSGDESGLLSDVYLESGNSVLVAHLSTPLPDADKYTFTVSRFVAFADGGPITSNRTRHLWALVGDVDASGDVTASDLLAVRGMVGAALDGSTAPFDVDASGAVTGADMLAVRRRLGNQLP